jgi:uncharacterized membrane protein YfcA
VATSVSDTILGIIIGSTIVVAATISLLQEDIRLPVTRAGDFLGGLAAGVVGTAVAIEGPVLALVLRSRPTAQIRPMLSAVLLIGETSSLVGLILAGSIDRHHWTTAGVLLPAMIAGVLASNLLLRRVDGRLLGRALLIITAVGGITVLVDTLLG